jgi:glutamate 5-kinase
VVKIGTNVLTRENGEMAMGRIHGLIEEIVDLHRRGLEVIIVSSGAISMGMDRLGLQEKPTFLPDKQACAAVGQIRLMSVYEQAFQRSGAAMGQILLTEDDFANRVRYLNLRNTMNRLLELGVIAVVNETDSVSTSEIETQTTGATSTRRTVFGDNDKLSALVTAKLGADLLVLLSDVDGLLPFSPDVKTGDTDSLVPLSLVEEITPEVEGMAREGNARGRGGMLGKLRSIRVALEGGGMAVIANGTKSGALTDVLAGKEVGTLFLSRRRLGSRKRWIAYATSPAARVVVNHGAREALQKRLSSLLFAGVVRVEGDCKRGDVVAILDEKGEEFARGIVKYSSQDATPLIGKRSQEIASAAGKDYEEFITRDNLVVLDE